MKPKNDSVLMLTCEHASNKLPAAFKSAVPAEVLKTHRAYDIGALAVFRKLVKFAKPEFYSEGKYSRLFVDLNRTITNKSAFSDFLRNNENAKAQATAYWNEYRAAIDKFVKANAKKRNHPPRHPQFHAYIKRKRPQHRHRDSLRPEPP